MYDIQKMTPTNKIEKPYLLAGVISYMAKPIAYYLKSFYSNVIPHLINFHKIFFASVGTDRF